MLPKFILSSDRKYITHTEFPAFVAEIEGLNINVKKVFSEVPEPDPKELARLMRLMGEWYQKQQL